MVRIAKREEGIFKLRSEVPKRVQRGHEAFRPLLHQRRRLLKLKILLTHETMFTLTSELRSDIQFHRGLTACLDANIFLLHQDASTRASTLITGGCTKVKQTPAGTALRPCQDPARPHIARITGTNSVL